MRSYVLGFVFNYSDEVLLMTKDHPPEQKNRLNGIGGKIKMRTNEPDQPSGAELYTDETPLEAMIRESSEEVQTEVPISWKVAGTFGNPGFWMVHVFCARFRLPIAAKEKEPVAWYSLYRLPEDCMYNLKYLVPLCYDIMVRRGGTYRFDIIEAQ